MDNLKEGVINYLNCKDQDLCWERIIELQILIDPKLQMKLERSLPCPGDFIGGCFNYYSRRLKEEDSALKISKTKYWIARLLINIGLRLLGRKKVRRWKLM